MKREKGIKRVTSKKKAVFKQQDIPPIKVSTLSIGPFMKHLNENFNELDIKNLDKVYPHYMLIVIHESRLNDLLQIIQYSGNFIKIIKISYTSNNENIYLLYGNFESFKKIINEVPFITSDSGMIKPLIKSLTAYDKNSLLTSDIQEFYNLPGENVVIEENYHNNMIELSKDLLVINDTMNSLDMGLLIQSYPELQDIKNSMEVNMLSIVIPGYMYGDSESISNCLFRSSLDRSKNCPELNIRIIEAQPEGLVFNNTPTTIATATYADWIRFIIKMDTFVDDLIPIEKYIFDKYNVSNIRDYFSTPWYLEREKMYSRQEFDPNIDEIISVEEEK